MWHGTCLSQIHIFGFDVIFVILVVFCLLLGPFRCCVVVLLLYLMRFPRFKFVTPILFLSMDLWVLTAVYYCCLYLCRWKIVNNNFCNFWTQEEDSDHFFILCPYLKLFWNKINEVLKNSKITFKIKLRHLVFGYKTSEEEYFDLNFFLTIVGFSIYKAYYISDQKTKNVNVYSIFRNEFNRRVCLKVKSNVLATIRKHITWLIDII